MMNNLEAWKQSTLTRKTQKSTSQYDYSPGKSPPHLCFGFACCFGGNRKRYWAIVPALISIDEWALIMNRRVIRLFSKVLLADLQFHIYPRAVRSLHTIPNVTLKYPTAYFCRSKGALAMDNHEKRGPPQVRRASIVSWVDRSVPTHQRTKGRKMIWNRRVGYGAGRSPFFSHRSFTTLRSRALLRLFVRSPTRSRAHGKEMFMNWMCRFHILSA